MSEDYSAFAWLAAGGWRPINEDVPVGVILETVQAITAEVPSMHDLRSFQGGRWPLGNWHWEPEGHLCSSEPTHWRRRLAVSASLEQGERRGRRKPEGFTTPADQ